MARTWLSIRVELVEGGGHASLWPRPGRIFTAARSHTFAALATAIDDAFARWDRAHLHRFALADGTQIGRPDWEGDDDWGEEPPLSDGRRLTLGRLRGGEQFLYTFDLGDDWTHLCTVARHGSTRSRRSGSPRTHPSPTGGGAQSPISTAAPSMATTATPTSRPTPSSPTSHHCDRTGDPATRTADSALLRTTDGSRSSNRSIRPTPGLTPTAPRHGTPAPPGRRWNRRPPESLGRPAMPTTRFPPQHDPQT